MLQQTVVTAAVGPFTAWMDRWPTLGALASATEDEVLRAWEGLGYASRARNLHRAAQRLIEAGQTNLPEAEDQLRDLPGIGDYTASAILSFAYHRPALTLDANLKRVFQRLDAAPEWTPGLDARWRTLWVALVDGPASRESNQAVMQLGQRVCQARSPRCGACPLAGLCRARAGGLTDQVPAPRARQVIEKATPVVFWVRAGEGEGAAPLWYLARPNRGRFSNLWLVPPVLADLPARARALGSRVHTYTKYRDRLSPWVAPWAGSGDPPTPEGWSGRWVTAAEGRDLGLVSVYRTLWNEALNPGQLR